MSELVRRPPRSPDELARLTRLLLAEPLVAAHLADVQPVQERWSRSGASFLSGAWMSAPSGESSAAPVGARPSAAQHPRLHRGHAQLRRSGSGVLARQPDGLALRGTIDIERTNASNRTSHGRSLLLFWA